MTESGETREVIDQLKMYQSQNTKIVVITNKPGSTIDQMADLGIYYYVKDIILPQTYNISSQVPVLYILERVTHERIDFIKFTTQYHVFTSTINHDINIIINIFIFNRRFYFPH